MDIGGKNGAFTFGRLPKFKDAALPKLLIFVYVQLNLLVDCGLVEA